MLVGPSITLEKLEQHLKDRIYEIRMEIPKLKKEFAQLQNDFKQIPRVINDVNHDKVEERVNPDFVKIPEKFKAVEEQIKELQEQEIHIQEKLQELEDIEERSKGKNNIDKSKYKITLTLKDCLMLGIELNRPLQNSDVGLSNEEQ
ncbi:hypothetical protein B14_200176 (plasmid) [Bacillus licheniformis]|uniref:hypothetical protein n=1 Tax=Bacillus licheniformis TaxID=1402 RepID=UPI0009B77022|nr:hypothetical protein [Bacillus licheniformis]ARC67387.1 hypothetical protein B14_200176 [Bacillus licheniformis]ARW46204.1 hypothetical protein S100141_04986 [Bacillus licheniformis]MDE1421817.1 hypothetical protein [Bacillus licheniformis]MEC0475822.1 hypothetical protein [Bacillus licheniformis]RHL11885.1 hypothetical protein DW032_19840 [Bacillus licheniformis]